MRTSPAPAFILAVAVALAAPAAAAPVSPQPKTKAHGISLTGRVTRIEASRMSLAVRDGSGKETPIWWTAATKIAGGTLKAGDTVTLRYLDKDRKHIATYIRINAPVTAGPAGAPAAQTPTPPARAL